jgi:protoporphyrinogen/coproporphyrinogen III oxidase
MIGIVGAGISGLALGVELASRGVPFHIFERSSGVGGVIRSLPREGRILELGPQRLRPVPELLPHLERIPGWEASGGGGGTTPGEHRLLVGRWGRLHPVPASIREGWSTSLLSARGKLRLALEPFVPGDPSDVGLSSGEYLRKRAGREACEALLGPLFGGLYGSDPDDMDAARALLPALREMGGGRSLVAMLLSRRGKGLLDVLPMVPPGGMESLARSMAAEVRDRLTLDAAVDAIEPLVDGGWRILAGTTSLECDAVVLTTPPAAAAGVLDDIAPSVAANLRLLRMNRILLVHLALDPLPPGLGFQVAHGETSGIRGMTFSGHLDGSGSTAVAFLGGARHPHLSTLDDDGLAGIAVAEAERWTGSGARPLHVSRARMPAWDRSFRAMDALRLPEGIHLHANYAGRPGIIGRIREAARLAERLARQRAGSHAQEGSAASGSPVMA